MAGVDKNIFNTMFKEIYAPPIRDAVNRATVLLDVIKTRDEQMEGRNFIVPLISSKHKGITSRSGATKTATKLPTASAQGYNVATYAIKYHYGRIEVDGPAIRASKSDKGSFTRALDAEMKGLANSFPMDLNRQCYGDGTNALAVVTASGANTTTVVVDTTKFLEKDQPICLLVHSSGAALTATTDVTIVTVDSATAITVSEAITTVQTTHAVFSERDGTNGGPYRNALTGLKALVNNVNITNMSTAYVGGITRTGNQYWQANKVHNSGTLRPFTVGLFQQGITASRNNKNGGKQPDFAITNFNIWNTIGNTLAADKRYRGESTTLEGGWEALKFGPLTVVADKDAPDNDIFLLVKEHIFFLTQSEPTWADDDGNILRRVTNYDSYEAFMFCDKELATDAPSNLTLVTDIDVNLG